MFELTLQLTLEPTTIYYEYNSYSHRFALYKARMDGTDRTYLIPVQPEEKETNRKVIKGVTHKSNKPVPESYFAFMAFKADITIYVPDLPVY